MTVDQHMFCKGAIQDVRDELLWLRHRDPEYFQPLITKLEQVLRVLLEQSFVRQLDGVIDRTIGVEDVTTPSET
jgi:hypothetical protein